MQIESIQTEQEYKAALDALTLVFDASLDSPDGNYLELLATLIEQYEDEHYPIEMPSAMDAKSNGNRPA